MNHKISQGIDYKTATALMVVTAFAAILVTTVGTGHVALAKGNEGIKIHTDTSQKQECQTAGATSPVTASCTGISTNAVNQSGGVLSEEGK
jgi:hypothetical protein